MKIYVQYMPSDTDILLINITNGILFLPDLTNSPIAPNITAIIPNKIPAIAKSCLISILITCYSLSNAHNDISAIDAF